VKFIYGIIYSQLVINTK